MQQVAMWKSRELQSLKARNPLNPHHTPRNSQPETRNSKHAFLNTKSTSPGDGNALTCLFYFGVKFNPHNITFSDKKSLSCFRCYSKISKIGRASCRKRVNIK